MEVNVIDVGCAELDGAVSIPRLIEEFHPPMLLGLDPRVVEHESIMGETAVATVRAAAWVYDGEIGFDGSALCVSEDGRQKVACLDIVPLIARYAPVVLKIDAEGGEYPLLEHIIARDADLNITLAWVEWHGDDYERRAKICDALRCNVGTWRL